LIETYLKIDKLIKENEKHSTKSMQKIMKQIKKDDIEFVKLTTQAINRKNIDDIEVSTALIVNRAFVQSSKQILDSIGELLLSDEESDIEVVEG